MLLGTLVHELLAKLDGLEGQTQRLTKLLASPASSAATPPLERLQKANTITHEVNPSDFIELRITDSDRR